MTIKIILIHRYIFNSYQIILYFIVDVSIYLKERGIDEAQDLKMILMQ